MINVVARYFALRAAGWVETSGGLGVRDYGGTLRGRTSANLLV